MVGYGHQRAHGSSMGGREVIHRKLVEAEWGEMEKARL
jgi:hypothetical protein